MISIIVTYYNTGWMLGRCLESISEQTYDDYEVIVIDNGSTDNSKYYVDDVISMGKLKNCRYFRIDHTSKNEAINYGLDKVRGKYILFIDSAYDFVNINILHYYYWAMITTSSDMVVGDYHEVRYNTRIKSISNTPEDYHVMIVKKDRMIKCMHTPTAHSDVRYNNLWNKLFKADLFDTRRLSKDMGSEITLIRDVVLQCDTMAIVPFELYYRASNVNIKLDMTIADAYQERIDYLKNNFSIYNKKTLEGAQYLLLTNLVDIYRNNRDPEFRKQCAPILADTYKKYFYCIPNNKRADFITRICKKLLTK